MILIFIIKNMFLLYLSNLILDTIAPHSFVLPTTTTSFLIATISKFFWECFWLSKDWTIINFLMICTFPIIMSVLFKESNTGQEIMALILFLLGLIQMIA